MRKAVVILSLLFLVATPALANWELDQPVPNFSLPDATDPQTMISLSSFSGQVILLICFSIY